MSSYTLPRPYKPLSGNAFTDFAQSATHQALNVARAVVARKTAAPSPGLPDLPNPDAPKSKMPYILGGVAALGVLALVLGKRKK